MVKHFAHYVCFTCDYGFIIARLCSITNNIPRRARGDLEGDLEGELEGELEGRIKNNCNRTR